MGGGNGGDGDQPPGLVLRRGRPPVQYLGHPELPARAPTAAGDPSVRTTLIIPALNEAEVIGTVLARVPANLLDEVLVVDNGSTDRTAEVALRAGARVIIEPRRGYGAACWAGVSPLDPTTEIAVLLDVDWIQRPDALPRVPATLLA